jgi:hypothetical protein
MEQVIPTINLLDAPILERRNFGSTRHYISRDDKGHINAIACGVTDIISRSMPINPFLEKWKFGFGGEVEYKLAMDKMAYYGTILHILFGDLVQGLPIMLGDEDIEKMFNLNKLSKADGGLPEYSHVSLPATVNGTRYDADKYRKDAIAIWQFVQDCILRENVEVVGIELPLADFKQGFAGCLDLVVKVTEKDKMRYVIFDLKTGAGHYTSHDVQLNAYHRLLARCLDVPAEDVTMFDLHLKDYTEKTYVKYLSGNSKTTPYNLVKVDYDELWEHTLATYWLYNDLPDVSKKEINYNTTIDEVVKQIKGD